jgi:transcription elongation factor Elf1
MEFNFVNLKGNLNYLPVYLVEYKVGDEKGYFYVVAPFGENSRAEYLASEFIKKKFYGMKNVYYNYRIIRINDKFTCDFCGKKFSYFKVKYKTKVISNYVLAWINQEKEDKTFLIVCKKCGIILNGLIKLFKEIWKPHQFREIIKKLEKFDE